VAKDAYKKHAGARGGEGNEVRDESGRKKNSFTITGFLRNNQKENERERRG